MTPISEKLKQYLWSIIAVAILGAVIVIQYREMSSLKYGNVYSFLDVIQPRYHGEILRGDNCLAKWQQVPVYAVVRPDSVYRFVRIASQQQSAQVQQLYGTNKAVLFEVVSDTGDYQHLRFWLRNGSIIEHSGAGHIRLAGMSNNEYYLPTQLVNVLWVIN